MFSLLRTHWFLFSLIGTLLLSHGFANVLSPLAQSNLLRTGIVAIVMFAMALPVPLLQVGRSLRRPMPALLATILNIVLLPLLAWLFSLALEPLSAGGLIVASVVPCTLASAAVWTRRAGGNDTTVILVTLITSSTCFLIAPLWLSLLLNKSVQLDGWQAAIDLALTVFLPMSLGQFAALHSKIGEWARSRKEAISIFCQFGILTMVSIGAVQIGVRSLEATEGEGPWVGIVSVIVAAVGLHLLVLGIGWWLAERMGMSRGDRIAVALAGSQKTLMIGLKIAVDCGVSIVPMLVYHVGQLLLDAILVERWRKEGTREE